MSSEKEESAQKAQEDDWETPGTSNEPKASADPQMVREFMELTGCNKKLSESIIASHPSIEAAIEYFYGAPENEPTFETEEESFQQFQEAYEEEQASDEEAPLNAEDLAGLEISVASWNIDGLDNANRTTRFQACYYVINRIAADFVFLQEVVKEADEEIIAKFVAKNIYNAYYSDKNALYYTAILVSKQLNVVCHKIIHYPNSGMGRTLQILEGRLGPLKVFLLNTHLESMAEHSETRREQFRFCMKNINTIIQNNPGCLIYFGGDLNARDTEIQNDSSHIPRGLADAWMAAGSNNKTRYTFDMTKNDNKSLGRARCRFDRIFFYGPLHISSFELDGKQRIRSSLCFPSDHWAISCDFKA